MRTRQQIQNPSPQAPACATGTTVPEPHLRLHHVCKARLDALARRPMRPLQPWLIPDDQGAATWLILISACREKRQP